MGDKSTRRRRNAVGCGNMEPGNTEVGDECVDSGVTDSGNGGAGRCRETASGGDRIAPATVLAKQISRGGARLVCAGDYARVCNPQNNQPVLLCNSGHLLGLRARAPSISEHENGRRGNRRCGSTCGLCHRDGCSSSGGEQSPRGAATATYPRRTIVAVCRLNHEYNVEVAGAFFRPVSK